MTDVDYGSAAEHELGPAYSEQPVPEERSTVLEHGRGLEQLAFERMQLEPADMRDIGASGDLGTGESPCKASGTWGSWGP